jgi:uncharacterized small protein (DUF1192 family)
MEPGRRGRQLTGLRFARRVRVKATEAIGGPMASEDDDRPKRKITHEIGQDLSLLSVAELDERIALLRQEIERIEATAVRKRASRDAASQFFKS